MRLIVFYPSPSLKACFSTGIDRGRSSSLSDVQSSSGISSSKQTSEETSVTPSASSTLDPWPSKFESK